MSNHSSINTEHGCFRHSCRHKDTVQGAGHTWAKMGASLRGLADAWKFHLSQLSAFLVFKIHDGKNHKTVLPYFGRKQGKNKIVRDDSVCFLSLCCNDLRVITWLLPHLHEQMLLHYLIVCLRNWGHRTQLCCPNSQSFQIKIFMNIFIRNTMKARWFSAIKLLPFLK